MKKKSTLFVLLLFFVISAKMVFSQNIEFTYDDAGNRTGTDIVTLKETKVNDTSKLNKKGIIDKYKIIISPNPNGGVFGVTVLNINDKTPIKIFLFDVNGKIIYRNDKCKSYTGIDISSRNNGIYFLNVIVGAGRKTWKVIKE